jgi:hypothetical protein
MEQNIPTKLFAKDKKKFISSRPNLTKMLNEGQMQ